MDMKFDDLNLDDIFLESKTEILQEVGEGFDSKATRFLTGIDATLMQQAEEELAAVKTEAQKVKLISDLDGLIYELNRRKNEGTFWKFFKHWFVAGIVIPFVGGIVGLVWAAIKRGKIKSGETDAIINFLSDVKSRAQRLQLDVQTESMAQPNNGKKRGKAGDSKIILESVEDKLRNVDAWLKDVNENLKRLNVREDGTIVAANIDEATFGRNLEMTAARINVIAKSTLNAGSGIIAYSIALKLSRNLGLNVGGPLNVIQNFKAFLTLNPLAYSTNKKIVFVILGCALITIYNAIKFGSNIISYLKDRKNFAEKGEVRNSKVIIQNESQGIYSDENINAFLESEMTDYDAFLEAKKPAVKKNRGVKVEGGLQGLKSDEKKITVGERFSTIPVVYEATKKLINENSTFNTKTELEVFKDFMDSEYDEKIPGREYILKAEAINNRVRKYAKEDDEAAAIKKVAEVKQEQIITKTETTQLTEIQKEVKESIVEAVVKETGKTEAEAKKVVEDQTLGSVVDKAIKGEKLNTEEKELVKEVASRNGASSIWSKVSGRLKAYGNNRTSKGGIAVGVLRIVILYFIVMKLSKSVEGVEIKEYKNILSNLTQLKKIRPWKSVREFIIAGLVLLMANEAAKLGVGLGKVLVENVSKRLVKK